MTRPGCGAITGRRALRDALVASEMRAGDVDDEQLVLATRTHDRSRPCLTTLETRYCAVRDEGALRPRRLRPVPGPRDP
jgi:hypothetical protein